MTAQVGSDQPMSCSLGLGETAKMFNYVGIYTCHA